MDEDLIKKLKDNPYFSEFQKFIVSKIDELDSVDRFYDSELTNEEAGEVVKIRAETIVVLQSILSPFVSFNEKRKPTKKEIKAAEAKVGL